MDIASYIENLDSNTEQILADPALKGDMASARKSAIPEQPAFEPGDKWTVIEVLEHICKTERALISVLLRPSDNMAESEELYGQAELKKIIVDSRTQHKITAPEMLHPTGEISSFEQFEQVFSAQRNLLKQHLLSGEIAISNRTRKHPALGDMTVADWLHFLVLHTQRHMEQIKELV